MNCDLVTLTYRPQDERRCLISLLFIVDQCNFYFPGLYVPGDVIELRGDTDL